jgi:hypothetical protein
MSRVLIISYGTSETQTVGGGPGNRSGSSGNGVRRPGLSCGLGATRIEDTISVASNWPHCERPQPTKGQDNETLVRKSSAHG